MRRFCVLRFCVSKKLPNDEGLEEWNAGMPIKKGQHTQPLQQQRK